MPRPIVRFAAVAFAATTAIAPPKSWAAEFVVQPLTIAEMKAVFGQVESRIVVPARARISGTVREIRIHEGDQVREGEVAALIVDDKLALQLNAADAKIEALNSQLENAHLQLERAQQLRTSGTGSQANLDTARMQFEVVTNQIAAANAEKSVIAQSAREGDVLAPATGRVLTVPVTPGSVVLAGEEIARIAEEAHPDISLDKGDLVIFSSRTIPGNEKAVSKVQNALARIGVDLITDTDALVHVTGHPRREELKDMYAWLRPKLAVPMHGEARHLREHAKLARACGVST